MLSPPVISLPCKLLLFVLVDGWALVCNGSSRRSGEGMLRGHLETECNNTVSRGLFLAASASAGVLGSVQIVAADETSPFRSPRRSIPPGIASYVAGFDAGSLPPLAVQRANLAFIDSLGVMLAGSRSDLRTSWPKWCAKNTPRRSRRSPGVRSSRRAARRAGQWRFAPRARLRRYDDRRPADGCALSRVARASGTAPRDAGEVFARTTSASKLHCACCARVPHSPPPAGTQPERSARSRRQSRARSS